MQWTSTAISGAAGGRRRQWRRNGVQRCRRADRHDL